MIYPLVGGRLFMPKAVYYSKKYTASAAAAAAPAASSRKGAKLGAAALLACCLIALLSVLVVPEFVSGATPEDVASARAASSLAQEVQAVQSYGSVAEAMEAAGLRVALPASQPEGYLLTDARVVDGKMLELQYLFGRQEILFRVAQGKDDLSGADLTTFAYTATETVDEVTRSYAGASEKKYSLAVWANKGYSFAIVANSDLEPAALVAMAESVG